MVITGIALLALIIFIIVGVMAQKHQAKRDRINILEHQILQLIKFKNELKSHHSLEDILRIHRQLDAMHLAWNQAICPDKYGMFRTKQIATMDPSEVFLGDIEGLWIHSLSYWLTCCDEDAVAIVTKQYYKQVLSGIKAEITELEYKMHSL